MTKEHGRSQPFPDPLCGFPDAEAGYQRAAGLQLGQRVIELLLDHPAMREVGRIDLGTRDAQTFYAKLGFVEVAARSTRMVRERIAARRAAG